MLPAAHAHAVCTVRAAASTGNIAFQRGDWARRATPASSVKIALSLMGDDIGLPSDAHSPALPVGPHYPDWRASWKRPTDPANWLTQSRVCCSPQLSTAPATPPMPDKSPARADRTTCM